MNRSFSGRPGFSAAVVSNDEITESLRMTLTNCLIAFFQKAATKTMIGLSAG
jgi:hypothetical protein